MYFNLFWKSFPLAEKSSLCSSRSSLLHWGIWWERFQQCPKVPDLWEMTQATSSIFIIIYSSQPVFCNGNSFESTPLCRAIREPYWPSVSREVLRRAPFGKMKETVLNANIHRAWRSEKGLLPLFWVCVLLCFLTSM